MDSDIAVVSMVLNLCVLVFLLCLFRAHNSYETPLLVLLRQQDVGVAPGDMLFEFFIRF
jgi:hypothetical protein